MVDGKLDLVPRYRQKVRFVPLGLGRPVWVDDPHFNLDYHLRHTALPPPGSDEQLRRTAARIFAQHLDRNKPLWEIWMVEGLSENRWALLSKVHHCMVDGVSATDLMSVMFADRRTRREADRTVGARAGAERRGAARAHADAPHAQPVGAAAHACAPRRARRARRSRRPREIARGMPSRRAACARSAAPR